MPSPADGWDPDVYARFTAERAQPFHDLLALCTPLDGGRAVDLGCGTGELTAVLHRTLGAGQTDGIDSSPAMLAAAASVAEPGVRFAEGDIDRFGLAPQEREAYDLVLSNAALHWVTRDHVEVLAQWRAALRPGGQLAVQVPANADHPSHLVANEVAHEEPFLSALGRPPPDPVLGVLPPAAYAEALYELGFAEQHVRLQVHGHVLPATGAVVDWVSGTTLTRFRTRLAPDLFDAFLARYRKRLLAVLGDRQPYFYAFKRILFRARLP